MSRVGLKGCRMYSGSSQPLTHSYIAPYPLTGGTGSLTGVLHRSEGWCSSSLKLLGDTRVWKNSLEGWEDELRES